MILSFYENNISDDMISIEEYTYATQSADFMQCLCFIG